MAPTFNIRHLGCVSIVDGGVSWVGRSEHADNGGLEYSSTDPLMNHIQAVVLL